MYTSPCALYTQRSLSCCRCFLPGVYGAAVAINAHQNRCKHFIFFLDLDFSSGLSCSFCTVCPGLLQADKTVCLPHCLSRCLTLVTTPYPESVKSLARMVGRELFHLGERTRLQSCLPETPIYLPLHMLQSKLIVQPAGPKRLEL